jgi:hypothetical protein
LEALKVDGNITIGPASFRGIAAKGASATIHYRNPLLKIGPFTVERAEGTGTGAIFFDLSRDELRFDQVRTRLNPMEVAVWAEPVLVKDLLPYHFEQEPPALLINGHVGLKDSAKTNLAIEVNAPAGMSYTAFNKILAFSDLRGNLLFHGADLNLGGVSASILGGKLSGDARVSLAHGNARYEGHANVRNIDCRSLGKTLSGVANLQGQLNAQCAFSGLGEDPASVRGEGEVSVRDGNLLTLPFFTTFTTLFGADSAKFAGEIIPEARAAFTISNGAITTPDLTLEGNGFSLQGGGMLRDDAMDFNLRITAQGLPGLLFSPASHLFEATAMG